MFQKEITVVQNESSEYKFLGLSSEVAAPKIEAKGTIPFGINDHNTGFLLNLDENNELNKQLFEKTKSYEKELLKTISEKNFAEVFGKDQKSWTSEVASQLITPSVEMKEPYGIQLYVKVTKDTVVHKKKKVLNLNDSREALKHPRTKIKLALSPSAVGFTNRDGTITCRMTWKAKEILLVRPDDTPAILQKKFLEQYVLGNEEIKDEEENIFLDNQKMSFDELKLNLDKELKEYPNKGKAAHFKFLFLKTGVGKSSFGMDTNDEGVPTSMRFMLQKNQPLNENMFKYFQEFEEYILDQLVIHPKVFSLKGKQLQSWSKDKAVDRLVECIQDTEYGYDMKIKVPTEYDTKRNLFRVFDEEGRELDSEEIQGRLFGENGKGQRMRLLLQVSSISFFATQCRIVLKLVQARLVESSATGVSKRTLVDSEDEGDEDGNVDYGRSDFETVTDI